MELQRHRRDLLGVQLLTAISDPHAFGQLCVAVVLAEGLLPERRYLRVVEAHVRPLERFDTLDHAGGGCSFQEIHCFAHQQIVQSTSEPEVAAAQCANVAATSGLISTPLFFRENAHASFNGRTAAPFTALRSSRLPKCRTVCCWTASTNMPQACV